MKLTFEQITSAANGIIRTEQNDLGLELHRFSRDQEGFFYKTHPAFCKNSFFNGYFGRNCRTCAGVTLDFITDARKIEIAFGATEYAKARKDRIHLFDLYVDNAFRESYKPESNIVFCASGEKHRYTLYFPYYVFPIISSMELEGAKIFEPRKKEIEILFLGDSITHGAIAIHPSNTYVMRVARNLGVGVLNQGNSGFVYDAGSIEKVCNPKVIVTAYGINDYMRKDLLTLKKDAEAFLRKLKETYSESKIVSILPLWTVWDAEQENFKMDKRKALEEVYKQYSDVLVDGHTLIPHDKKYLADDVHPNDEGFAFYAEKLSKILLDLI
jgi:lysophospholipase L1-like esterase